MIISHRLLAMTTGLLILVGCTGTPKPVSHEVPTKRPYWEYTYLGGVGSDKSPEADRLRQAGWVFIGYNRHHDTIIMDGLGTAPRMNYGTVQRDVMQATFKRECK
jgi:hypothetical protein